MSGANQAHLQIWCINLSKFKVLIKQLMECYLFQYCHVATANSEKCRLCIQQLALPLSTKLFVSVNQESLRRCSQMHLLDVFIEKPMIIRILSAVILAMSKAICPELLNMTQFSPNY